MVQTTLEDEVKKIGVLLRTMAPDLFGSDPTVDSYEESAVMEYIPTSKLEMENVLNILEDDVDLAFIYSAKKSNPANGEQHACMAEDPSSGHMYKVNVFTDHDGQLSRITVSVYQSIDDMMNETTSDMDNHRSGGFYIDSEISQREFKSLFMGM